jgi:hypothetical protein
MKMPKRNADGPKEKPADNAAEARETDAPRKEQNEKERIRFGERHTCPSDDPSYYGGIQVSGDHIKITET